MNTTMMLGNLQFKICEAGVGVQVGIEGTQRGFFNQNAQISFFLDEMNLGRLVDALLNQKLRIVNHHKENQSNQETIKKMSKLRGIAKALKELTEDDEICDDIEDAIEDLDAAMEVLNEKIHG